MELDPGTLRPSATNITYMRSHENHDSQTTDFHISSSGDLLTRRSVTQSLPCAFSVRFGPSIVGGILRVRLAVLPSVKRFSSKFLLAPSHPVSLFAWNGI